MKYIEVNPPNNGKMEGKFYIVPIEQFSAKGTNWIRQLVFKTKTVAIPKEEKTFYCRYWGSPKYEVTNCGNTGYFDLDGSGWKDCMCEECVAGRIEVKNGWMPQ